MTLEEGSKKRRTLTSQSEESSRKDWRGGVEVFQLTLYTLLILGEFQRERRHAEEEEWGEEQEQVPFQEEEEQISILEEEEEQKQVSLLEEKEQERVAILEEEEAQLV